MAMGNFKKQSIIIVLFIAFLNLNCNDSKKVEKNKFEKNKMMTNESQVRNFDIEKYEDNLKKSSEYDGYSINQDTYVKQYHIVKEGYIEETYQKNLVANYVEEIILNNKFRDVHSFDNNGKIISTKHYFGNSLEIGKWVFYEKENQVNIEDKDENFQFSLDQVIKYGKQNEVDFLKTGEIIKSNSKIHNCHVWELTWNTGKMENDGESYLFKKVILNANSGKQLETKEFYLNPLAR